MMKKHVSSFIRIRKSREGSRTESTVGAFYLVDTYKNIVVDDHLPTLTAARQRKAELAKTSQYSGTIATY
jgi:hypothetical protein